MSFPLYGKNYTATLLNWAPKLTALKKLLELKENAPEWVDWTPTFSATAPLTWTGVTVAYAKYRVLSNKVEFIVSGNGTTGGGPGGIVTFTLPVTVKTIFGIVFNGFVVESGGAIYAATVTAADPVTMNVRRYDQGNYAIGAGHSIAIQGFYEI